MVSDRVTVGYKVPGAGSGDADTLDGLHAGELLSGWISVSDVWTYAGADNPVYQVYVSGDVTSDPNYKLGHKVRCANSGTTFYGFIVKVNVYDSTNDRTPVYIYGGIDYSLVDGVITSPCISKVKSPDGFPLDPEKWSISLVDTSQQAISSPTNDWCSPGSLSIYVPIGLWAVYSQILVSISINTSAGEGTAQARTTISSSLTDASHSELSRDMLVMLPLSTNLAILRFSATTGGEIISVTSPTTFYLLARPFSPKPIYAIEFRGDLPGMATYVKFVCAYL